MCMVYPCPIPSDLLSHVERANALIPVVSGASSAHSLRTWTIDCLT